MSDTTIIDMKEVVPKIMYYQNKMHDITYVDPSLVIKGYKINLNNSEVESVKLFNSHPNSDPKTNKFCLPSNVIGKKLEEVKDLISYLLSVYNIDSCYFSPWGLIKYKER
jgi:hypothetical protein